MYQTYSLLVPLQSKAQDMIYNALGRSSVLARAPSLINQKTARFVGLQTPRSSMSYSYELHILWEAERMAHNMTRVYPDPKGKIHPSNPPFPKKINGFGLFYSGELRIFDLSGSFLLEGQDMSLMKTLVKEWVRSVKYHQSTRPSPLAYQYQF